VFAATVTAGERHRNRPILGNRDHGRLFLLRGEVGRDRADKYAVGKCPAHVPGRPGMRFVGASRARCLLVQARRPQCRGVVTRSLSEIFR
jgi:hypothetical protein